MPKLIHDSETRSEEQALTQALQDEWHETLLPLLPEQLEQQATQLKAFERARGLRGAGDLLRGILASAFCLSSFRHVGAWATSLGISANGERSWAKRSRQARLWLLWLLQPLLVSPLPVSDQPRPVYARILLVDASHWCGWRKQGDHARLHVSDDLHAQRLAHVVLTTQQEGERLTTFAVDKGDILVADRGYCRRQAIWDVLQAGGQLVVRLHWLDVPVQREDGSPVELCQWVTSLCEDTAEQRVWMHLRNHRVALRLLAHRLSPEAASRAKLRQKRKATKNGRKLCHPWSAVLADWLLVLTSLPATPWNAESVLDLYRARWQIELLFNRIKQLVRIHRLRRPQLEANEATLAALLLGWVLIERQAAHLRAQFLPLEQTGQQQDPGHGSDNVVRPISTWERDAVLVQSLRSMILGPWTWTQIQQKLDQIARLLICHPPARVHQESTILAHLEQVLAALQP
jgi:hypothetical protein